jgi:hypothetical protein
MFISFWEETTSNLLFLMSETTNNKGRRGDRKRRKSVVGVGSVVGWEGGCWCGRRNNMY